MGHHRRQPRDGPCALGWRREHRLCNHRPWLRREEKHFVDILLHVLVNIHVIVALILQTSGAVPVAAGTGRFPSVWLHALVACIVGTGRFPSLCGAAELGKGAGNLVWERLRAPECGRWRRRGCCARLGTQLGERASKRREQRLQRFSRVVKGPCGRRGG